MSDAIIEGGTYIYVRGHPAKCIGSLYMVHRLVMDVPAYQHKVLVEALDGPDKGLWFTCSPANFRVRYEMVDPGADNGIPSGHGME